jgi:hypothetical protein
MKEIMYVIRRPDGRYYSRVNPEGVLLPEDAALFGNERIAEYDFRKLSPGHQIFDLDNAPMPSTTLVALNGYFAQAIPSCARRRTIVQWVGIEYATRWTEQDLPIVLSMNPGSHKVTDEEALEIERLRIAKEGSEYQYEKSYGF